MIESTEIQSDTLPRVRDKTPKQEEAMDRHFCARMRLLVLCHNIHQYFPFKSFKSIKLK